MLFSNPFKARLPLKAEALPGRSAPIFDGGAHCVLGTPTTGPFPDHLETVQLGLGCFWGAERLFWKLKGLKRNRMRKCIPWMTRLWKLIMMMI